VQAMPNKSLQRTFDPVAIFAIAKTPTGSNATEFKRYIFGGLTRDPVFN